MIDYLVELGVTAVELLPIHAVVDDRHLVERGLTNYWGYNTIGFFAPDPRFAAGQAPIAEFKTMVKRLHEAGIEVILDVVYNHTAEGNHLGPTLSFRGIDNALLLPARRSDRALLHGRHRHRQHAQPRSSARAAAGHGLAALLGDRDARRRVPLRSAPPRWRARTATTARPQRSSTRSGRIRSLAGVKLIAEPWDLGPDGYQLGNFPPGWAEWNGQYRDAVRRFWKGDSGLVAELASRVAGSSDIFGYRGRRPWASINFITAHDGFTLQDLVSYNDKHNEANGEDNRDGNDDNLSWNCGVEGPSDDPAIVALRERQKRNLLATLLLSHGVPMLLAGDEIGRTQRGNNNAYCQDNEISWLDWENIRPEDEDLARFVSYLVHLRRRPPGVLAPAFSSRRDALRGRGQGHHLGDRGWGGGDRRGLEKSDRAVAGLRVERCRRRVLHARRPARHRRELPRHDERISEDLDFRFPLLAAPMLVWEALVDTAEPTGLAADGRLWRRERLSAAGAFLCAVHQSRPRGRARER